MRRTISIMVFVLLVVMAALVSSRAQNVKFGAITVSSCTGCGGGGGTGTVVNLLNAAGVTCNGSADDTSAIQTVYTSVANTFAPHIIWPPAPAQCVLSSTISLSGTANAWIQGGSVLWKGNATSVSDPVFLYSDDDSSFTTGFYVTTSSASTYPMWNVFQIQQDSNAGPNYSENNVFDTNTIQCKGTGGCQNGFGVTDGAIVNGVNDNPTFRSNLVFNYTHSCFKIYNSQYGPANFENNECEGPGGSYSSSGSVAVDDAPGGGNYGAELNWYGGLVLLNSHADFFAQTQSGAHVLISGAHSEDSGEFLNVPFSNGSTPVVLENDTFAVVSGHINGSCYMVDYESPGPLNIHGGSWGQAGPCAGQFYMVSTSGWVFGDIEGAASTTFNSNATNLLTIYSPSTNANYVCSRNNVYWDGSGNTVPPTAPDICGSNGGDMGRLYTVTSGTPYPALPAPSSVAKGTRFTVTDATSITPGHCVGGGTNWVTAISDGTNWNCP